MSPDIHILWESGRRAEERAILVDEITPQVRADTPQLIIDQIILQALRAKEAGARVEIEGLVVRDSKGSTVQHPGIKIESDAGKIAADLVGKYKADVSVVWGD